MASLDIPSLIPLPESSETTPQSATTRASSPNNQLLDLLTNDPTDPLFPPTTSKAPSSATSRSAPIPIPRAPESPEFGSFVASRAHHDPLGAHDFLTFGTPQQESDPVKEFFLDGAHERVKDRKERVVRELLDHEDEPMYWHARQVVTSPEDEPSEPPLGQSPKAATQPLPRDTSVSPPPPHLDHPTHHSRDEISTDPGPSTEETSADERHTRGKSRQQSLSQSPSRYDTLRRTLSRGVTSLFTHAPIPALPSTSPNEASQSSSSPRPAIPSLPSSYTGPSSYIRPSSFTGPGLTHNTPFGPHHHSTLAPSGAPGFFEPDVDWDKGDWSSDAAVIEPKKRLAMEKIELKGRNAHTSPVLTTSVAALIRPSLPPLSRLPRSWNLLYSLDQHGISIHTFYREIAKSFDPPNTTSGGCVLAIRDDRGGVFGAWIGERIRMGGGSYYGSGESFLWKLDLGVHEGEEVAVKVYKWTGKNEYVALCEDNYISFGGGDGRTGLYLDSAFDRGTSEQCPCFDNEPLCYSADGAKGRFTCVGLEVWRVGGL